MWAAMLCSTEVVACQSQGLRGKVVSADREYSRVQSLSSRLGRLQRRTPPSSTYRNLPRHNSVGPMLSSSSTSTVVVPGIKRSRRGCLVCRKRQSLPVSLSRPAKPRVLPGPSARPCPET